MCTLRSSRVKSVILKSFTIAVYLNFPSLADLLCFGSQLLSIAAYL